MNKIIPSIIIALCYLLFSTLAPWWNEVSGTTEIEKQAKEDAKSCAPYLIILPKKYISDVLYCQCKHNKSKPGKCRNKYK